MLPVKVIRHQDASESKCEQNEKVTVTQKGKIKNWEDLVNDGDNYGGEDYSPLEKLLIESIKNKTILKIQDSFLFFKTGEQDPAHGKNLAELIARFNPLKDITSLIVAHNGLGPDAVETLSESPILTRIEYLHLGSNRLGDEGAKVIAQSKRWENLNYLNLECNNIGLEGPRALAASPYLKQLTSLNLVDNRMGDEGVLAIARSPLVEHLDYLHLGGNRLKDPSTKNSVKESLQLAHIQTIKIF